MCINLSYACLRTARSHPQCVAAGLDRIVVNGLEPITNRQTLELCDKYPHLLLPALGIYPLDACCHALAKDPSKWAFDFPPPAVFDIDQVLIGSLVQLLISDYRSRRVTCVTDSSTARFPRR